MASLYSKKLCLPSMCVIVAEKDTHNFTKRFAYRSHFCARIACIGLLSFECIYSM